MQETYFIPRAGRRRNPGGKLFNKIVNFKQKAGKRKQREEAHLASKRIVLEPEATVTDPVAEAAIQWLSHNRHPWTTALDKWELSYPIRKKHLKSKKSVEDLYWQYQLYQEEHGYQAVSFFSSHTLFT